MKMKKPKSLKLKASARDNRRYLLINEKDRKKIEDAVLDYVGVLGFAKFENVRAGLCLAGISVDKVSGTLKGLGV